MTNQTTKHTPGPWEISKTQIDSSPYQIMDRDGNEVAATIYGQKGGTEEAKANAQLIARSPSMLAVLKTAAEMIRSSNEFKDAHFGILAQAVNGIEEEIKRAEGRV